MNDRMQRLEELTKRLTEVPDSAAPPIPEEGLRACGDREQVQTEGEAEGRVEQ